MSKTYIEIEKILDLDIDTLGLDGYAYWSLRKSNINKIGDIAILTEKELSLLNGIGTKYVKDIKQSLQKFGIYLKDAYTSKKEEMRFHEALINFLSKKIIQKIRQTEGITGILDLDISILNATSTTERKLKNKQISNIGDILSYNRASQLPISYDRQNEINQQLNRVGLAFQNSQDATSQNAELTLATMTSPSHISHLTINQEALTSLMSQNENLVIQYRRVNPSSPQQILPESISPTYKIYQNIKQVFFQQRVYKRS